MDIRLFPLLLPAFRQLFTGAILHGEKKNVLVITTEIYSRRLQLDRHTEASGKSLPPSGTSLSCGNIPSADGYGLKEKLNISTNEFNIFRTSSIVLGPDIKVYVGPGVGIKAVDFSGSPNIHLRRASLDGFSGELHCLSTVFTFCDTPRGYGANPESIEKLASVFLQLGANEVLCPLWLAEILR